MITSTNRMRREFYTHRQPELDTMLKRELYFKGELDTPPYNSDEEQEVEKYQTNIHKQVLHI